MTFDEWFAKEYHDEIGGIGEDGLRDLLREAWEAAISSTPQPEVASPDDGPMLETREVVERWNHCVEECALAVEGCLKERQPTAFYADIIRALKSSSQPQSLQPSEDQ